MSTNALTIASPIGKLLNDNFKQLQKVSDYSRSVTLMRANDGMTLNKSWIVNPDGSGTPFDDGRPKHFDFGVYEVEGFDDLAELLRKVHSQTQLAAVNGVPRNEGNVPAIRLERARRTHKNREATGYVASLQPWPKHILYIDFDKRVEGNLTAEEIRDRFLPACFRGCCRGVWPSAS